MQTHIATTPFGRRPMSLAMLAVQKEAAEIPEGKTVDKWKVYRDLCEAKSLVGVGDRALAILAALFSFYPDDHLSEDNGLVVFPSNRQLALRAHGMSEVTLRRHLAALVSCGLIIRRDSPNGKRYARKGREGGLEDAFGFSLAPILVRADEFARAAETVRAESKALRHMREHITLLRRDIGKLIETALEECIPGDWTSLWRRFRQIVETIPRRATIGTLSPIFTSLAAIRNDIDIALEQHLKTQDSNGNESHSGRHQSNSNTNANIEFEPASETSRGSVEPAGDMPQLSKSYPLGLVLKACPEIVEYAVDGIHSWREFMAVTAQVRGYLGISPSAYTDALEVMGQETTAIVIACILGRAHHINSAGGYLRVLTEKAREGEFSAGPMLMAALRTNHEPIRQAG
jgi:replication initiation protein RepC